MTKRVEGLVAKWRQEVQDRRYQAPLDRIAIRHAQELEQALAADRAEAGELPELPEPVGAMERAAWGPKPDYYTADQLRAYGQQCARAASCGGGEVVYQRRCTEHSYCVWQEIDRELYEAGLRDPGHNVFRILYTTPPTPSAGVEVTDAYVEAVWNALPADDIPTLTRRKLRAALTAALEGGK